MVFKDIAGFVETRFERNMTATTLMRDVLGRQNKKKTDKNLGTDIF